MMYLSASRQLAASVNGLVLGDVQTHFYTFYRLLFVRKIDTRIDQDLSCPIRLSD